LIFGESHPYGRVYELEDFETLTLEDIRQHYKTHYDWGNANILVAGAIDEKSIALLNDTFGHIQPKISVEAPTYPLADYTAKKERFSLKDAQQAALRVGMRSIDRSHSDFYKFSFVNTLFGAHFSSRLMTNIREDKGYTYGIYSYLSNYKNGNAWEISAEVGTSVADAALQEIYHEMERLSKEPVSNEEMLLVKNYLSGRLLSGLDGVFKQATYYKALLIFGLNYGYIYGLIKTIQTITAEDVMQIAQKYLQKESMTELVVE
jgi:predicted Zn-dependent peptidase